MDFVTKMGGSQLLDDGSAEFTRFLQQTPIYVFCALVAQKYEKNPGL